MRNQSDTKGAAEAMHLWAALTAIAILAVALTGGVWYARTLERRAVHAVAPEMFDQKDLGTALQSEAFRQPDLLPLYGSSEMRILDPYHPSTLFREYPTGFTVFPIGQPGTTCLVMLQRLAAVGQELRGRKVALSLTPSWFCEGAGTVTPGPYAGNFSRLHANALTFSTDLSLPVRQEAARRMLTYPATLQNDPVLKFSLERLAGSGADDLLFYYTALPLGKLQGLVYRLQDHAETVFFLRRQQGLDVDLPRRQRALDWVALHTQAEGEYKAMCDNNPYGFANPLWEKQFRHEAERLKGKRTDMDVQRTVQDAKEWTDFRLLLQALDELGADPLLLGVPMQGRYYDYLGISAAARRSFYEKLNQTAMTHARQVISFADHDEDRLFLVDRGHLSRKGWVFYNEALDAFYYGTRASFFPPEGTPYPVNAPPAPAESGQKSPGSPQTLAGNIDRADSEMVVGWAWDSTRPDSPVRLEVYDGQTLLAAITADQFRQDLLKSGKGNGKHAFPYTIPANLRAGKPYRIAVPFAGTNITLRRAPLGISSGQSQSPAGNKGGGTP